MNKENQITNEVNDVLFIFPFGSRIYGTNNHGSDYDFYVLSNTSNNGTEVRNGDLNYHLITVDHFKSMIKQHKVIALECYFHSNPPFEFKLDKSLLRKEFSSVSSNSWVKAKKKLEVEKEHAYISENTVYFDVSSYSDHGKLLNRKIEQSLSRLEQDELKKNSEDFVLWKPSTENEPGWNSPWGFGRPGWHIECSAMSQDLLGDSFDIHGGGIDLQFPHHENEIAQSKCSHSHGTHATYWVHNEMLTVDGKKMSKSLNNFFTVRDLLDKGYDGSVIKLVFMQTHYRKTMNWTEEKYNQLKEELYSWSVSINDIRSTRVSEDVIEALSDDLNTSEVLTVLRNLYKSKQFSVLKSSLEFLGIEPLEITAHDEIETSFTGVLFNLYKEAKLTSNFDRIDQVKSELKDINISISFTKEKVILTKPAEYDKTKLLLIMTSLFTSLYTSEFLYDIT